MTRSYYAETQNLGSSACGSRDHGVSAFVEFGGSFRAGAGLRAPGFRDSGSHEWRGRSLIAAAANAGITLSDTPEIYEQGKGERILGDALKSIDGCIITKARLRFSLAKSVLLPLRGAAEPFSVHWSHARAAAAAARAKPLPRNYIPEYFRPALLGSLHRSQREQADIFLLHSPSAADLKDGEALDRLSTFKQEGLAEMRRRFVRRSSDVGQYRIDERVEAISSSGVVKAVSRVHHVDTLHVVGCVTFTLPKSQPNVDHRCDGAAVGATS